MPKSPVRDELIVLKFGSSVLRTHADLPNAVHEVYRWYRRGYKVVVVVSAIGQATDHLLRDARALSRFPEPYSTAKLLATGERASAALLGIALDRAGVPARVLDPREIALTAVGSPLDGELQGVNVSAVRAFLSQVPVLVIPGFIGTDSEGRTHLLGRGGSDLTAVFLARALQAARCRLIKDVDGVYERDPAEKPGGMSSQEEAAPRRFRTLDYAHALEVASPLIQSKAVAFLRQYWARAEVAACASAYETTVHAGPVGFDGMVSSSGPLKVLLLGLGTVGYGVYERLLANPELFRVVGVLVRDRVKYEQLKVPGGLLRTRAEQVLQLRADLVVDALPDTAVARSLVEHFLTVGVPVVSAGKGLIAESGARLIALARDSGAKLSYSAAVGGAAPMIEAVQRCAAAGPISSLAAVLNGTCNFVLDRCAEGGRLEEALAEAQHAGFVEADPRVDLDGHDAAHKAHILARHAFGTEAKLVEVVPMDESVARWAQQAPKNGLRLRQLARAARCDGEVRALVKFEAVPAESPFGRLRGEWNCLQIVPKDGAPETVTGRGAGRWPSTEAVMADVFDALRQPRGLLLGGVERSLDEPVREVSGQDEEGAYER